MTYSGHVQPGGPAAVRELDGLMITKCSVGPMDNNAYLLTCRETGERLLVDAANEGRRLLEMLGEQPGDGLARVVTTHRHGDHWQALGEVVAGTGAETLAGRDDATAIPVPTDRPLDDGDTVQVGAATLRVITLVGHTPGSVALLYDDASGTAHLFTGDSLFPGGPGRTTAPENFASLMSDLQRKVFDQLPDDTWFYPGHGDDSTLGAERGSIPEWLARGW